MTEGTYRRAALASEITPGVKRVVDIEGQPVLLCNSNGRIHAVTNICSHAHEALDGGRMSNGWIACPIHGARFDLATGAVINPPAIKPIAVYEFRIVDDWIEVKRPPIPSG